MQVLLNLAINFISFMIFYSECGIKFLNTNLTDYKYLKNVVSSIKVNNTSATRRLPRKLLSLKHSLFCIN